MARKSLVLLPIENAILKALDPLGREFNVAIGRLDASSLNRPVVNCHLYLNYRSTQYDTPIVDDPTQVQTISFDVLVRFADLRTHDTSYPLLEAIAAELNGLVVTAEGLTTLDSLDIKSQEFQDKLIAEGLWLYRQVYEIQIQYCPQECC